MGWQHGVQYQCLATQNPSAALIGGNTAHTWAHIRINQAEASEHVYCKSSDGIVDALFEDCLGMRWVILDELSTFSTMLLHLLDGNLRRACKRHPYAKRADGSWRPFGGINVVFCGDFWQLPPVRATSLFSNPFRRDDRYEYYVS